VDCRKSLAPEAVSKLRFAEVQYHDMGTHRRAVVLIKPDSSVRADDSVVFNIKDCTKALKTQAKKSAH
jgi:hypothetical protein